jgi:organic hydroperoxide reductase OsmC/OhrA
MRTIRIVAAAALIVASVLASYAALAQPGITRTNLMRHDLSASGREVIQVLVEFAPGVPFPAHGICPYSKAVHGNIEVTTSVI